MKTTACLFVLFALLAGCGGQPDPGGQSQSAGGATAAKEAPKPASLPPLDPNNIVSIALKSPDHSTLVAALQAADYVIGVANPGPLTVFAPTNAAFDLLPAGTVETLLKPENVGTLRHILQHHVIASVYTADALHDGDVLGMVDGTKVTVTRKDGKIMIGDATIAASIRASNGIIHVIDKVLLPPDR